MTVRQRLEQEERTRLSPYAKCAADTAGRAAPISPDDMRTDFQRDRDRIIHCKSFRRLKYKTQVFLSPVGDHYRTRLTHTLEVAQVARTLARCLQLNEDLTEAIALGHDLGHTPFGHIGENTLNKRMPGGFRHNEQSLRMVERLEREGAGLNLCQETRDGILCHSGPQEPSTLEGWCVRRADRILHQPRHRRRYPRRHSEGIRAASALRGGAGQDPWRANQHHDRRRSAQQRRSEPGGHVRRGAGGQRPSAGISV